MSEVELSEETKRILLKMAARVRRIRESEAIHEDEQVAESDESLVSDGGDGGE